MPVMKAVHSFVSEHFISPAGPFKDCLEALESGYTTSGMYLLKPDNGNRLMQVWCDQGHDPGGWSVILRRQDGSVNFFRNWETYKVMKLSAEIIRFHMASTQQKGFMF